MRRRTTPAKLPAQLEQLRQQAAVLSSDRELLAVLAAERSWLLEAPQTVAGVRSLREDDGAKPVILTDEAGGKARRLYDAVVGGNAVVVQRLLAERGTTVSVRTIKQAVTDLRLARRAAELATVRVESVPGDRLQIDFGQNGSALRPRGDASSSWSRSSVIPAACFLNRVPL